MTEPFVQRDHFTLLNTETEGETKLRRAQQGADDRIYYLETVVLGSVELLHEHGIDAEEFNPDAEIVPLDNSGEHGSKDA